jgi:hypothetical protein
MMNKGLASPMMPMIVDVEREEISPTDNAKNMKMVQENWNLGPEKASEDPAANKEYWMKMAEVWQTSEKEARRQLCANCEYFENTPEMMERMDVVPFSEFDADGGGRGFCHKFDFICHNLRTCQAWERKCYMNAE